MSSELRKDIAEGVTKGILTWGKEEVKQFVHQFKNHEIAFIKNTETVETAKEQKATSEYKFFLNCIKDKKLCILFQMGLTLRRVEKNKRQWTELRDRIYKRYGIEGLHVAQFVQNGLFYKFFAILMEKDLTPEQCSNEIKNFFDNIETTNSYIQNTDNITKISKTIITRIQSNAPHTYIISGSKTAARKCRQIKNKVMKNITGYQEESYKTAVTEVYFLKKNN
jgi:hypothetical protein